ncbi:MAG: hypothetical protein LBK95_09535, partial [Bifidobacteriaceae bacterium]|nr:hypothetical protein [Bifidobacteriaceae bacterium]
MPVPRSGAVPVPYGAPGGYAPVLVAPGGQPPVPQAEPLPENPVRAIVLAGAAVAAMLLTSVTGWGKHLAYLNVLEAVALACAAYLILKPGRSYKIMAILVGLAAPLAYCLNQAAYFVAVDATGVFLAGTSTATVALSFGANLLSFVFQVVVAAAAVGAAAVATVLFRADPRKRTTMAALFAGGGYALAGLVVTLIGVASADRMYPGIYIATGVSGVIICAAALGVAVKFVGAVCSFKSRLITATTGPKVWFALCLAFSIIMLIVNGILGAVVESNLPRSSSVDFFAALLAIVGIIGYLQLLRSRRLGYALILLAAGIAIVAQFSAGLNNLIWALPNANSIAMGSVIGGLATPLAGAINPVITGLVLMRAWKTAPVEPPVARRPVPVILKIGSITLLTLATGWFLLGSALFYGIGFNEEETALAFIIGFLFGTVLGGALAVLALFA